MTGKNSRNTSGAMRCGARRKRQEIIGGQCEGKRRAAHWRMLMGYKRSDGKLFLDVGHAPT